MNASLIRETDVLIVGAGPTGLVLALWLTRLGVRVRIVDKTPKSGTTSRAIAVQARTLELYVRCTIVTTALPNIGRTKSYALKGLFRLSGTSVTDSTGTTKTTATKSLHLGKKEVTSEAGNFLENALFRVRFQLWRGTRSYLPTCGKTTPSPMKEISGEFFCGIAPKALVVLRQQ